MERLVVLQNRDIPFPITVCGQILGLESEERAEVKLIAVNMASLIEFFLAKHSQVNMPTRLEKPYVSLSQVL
jgi:hypothetical protein